VPRFGYVSPSVSLVPSDLPALLPAGVSVAIATLNVRNGRPGEFERAIATMRGATDVLIDEGAGAIVVFGVPVSARRGFAAERDALQALTADRGAIPIVSSLAATVAGFGRLGVTRPLLITQYADDVNALIATFCADAGLAVSGAVGLGARNAAEVNARTPDDYERLARSALAAHPSADGIFLSARGSLLDVALRLEDEMRIPVVEQTQAGVWWALQQLGVPAEPGHGRLIAGAARV